VTDITSCSGQLHFPHEFRSIKTVKLYAQAEGDLRGLENNLLYWQITGTPPRQAPRLKKEYIYPSTPPVGLHSLFLGERYSCLIYNIHNIYIRIYLYYIYTYLLTPWSRVLLEKLTGLQLVKKFPAFYGTRRFITALTSAHHLSLS
jgi:hypothetical protein